MVDVNTIPSLRVVHIHTRVYIKRNHGKEGWRESDNDRLVVWITVVSVEHSMHTEEDCIGRNVCCIKILL